MYLCYEIFTEKPRTHWGDTSVDGRTILRWIFRKWDVGVWTGLCWLRIETGGGALVNAVMILRVP
jgi:hypothetical protein